MKILIQSKRGQAYVKPVVVVAFLVGLCLSGISTQAYVIRDDFVGAVDTPLKDTYTPTGHAQWIALRDTDFMYDGNCLKVGAINEEAYVNFTSNAIVRMQGAMQVSSTGNWLAMKMGGTTTYPVSGNGIAVMLGTTGNFDMYVNTTVVMSIYSNAYTYNTTGFNTTPWNTMPSPAS